MKTITTLLLTLIFFNVSAGVKYGGVTGNWNTGSIWSPPGAPQLSDTVKIASGVTITIPTNVNARANSIMIYGTLVNKGTINLPGFLSVDGQLDCKSGSKVIFSGTNIQAVTGIGYINFYDVDFNINSKVKFTNTCNFYNNIKLLSASTITISSTANFILKSDSINTARILSIPDNAIITGNITQERFTKEIGYHMIGFTSSGFNCTTYDETQPGSLNIGYINHTITPFQGGFINNTTTNTTWSQTGVISRSVMTIDLNCSGVDGINDGWNLVANPYPSEIDIESTDFITNGITDMFYTWDAANNNYIWWKRGAGGTWSNKIASGQGFWVQSYDPISSLKINELAKTTSGAYYRTTLTNQFKIQLQSDSDTTWCMSRLDNWSNEYSVDDGLYLQSNSSKVSEIFTKTSDNYNVVVDSRPLPQDDDTIVIPIWVNIPTIKAGTTYHITLDGMQNLDNNYFWYLKYASGFITTATTTLDFTRPTGMNYIASIYICKNRLNSVAKDSQVAIDSEPVSVFDLQGRQVTPNSPGNYIYVYKVNNNYIYKVKYKN